MNLTVARLTAGSVLGRRRVVLLVALPLVFVLLCGAARMFGDPGPIMSVALLGGFGFATIVPLLGLIVGTGAIGPEIDDGSIIYLLSKPLSRHAIVLSKFLVAAIIVVVAAAGPMLLAGYILTGQLEGLASAYAIGAAVAGVAYSALFVLLAILTRHAVVVGLLYAAVWESVVGNFVPGAQAISIQQWALAVTEKALGASAEDFAVASAVSLPTSLVLLGIAVVGGVWLAGSRLRTLRIADDA